MERPVAPYKGAEPYVFVSYAHRDERAVMHELGWIDANAIPFWYDEGIYAGEDWRDAIGDAVKGSSICLFFVSKQSVRSDHCIREVKFALDNAVPVLPVYLEPAELPTGLALALSNIQAILKFSVPPARYEAQTIETLREALELQRADVRAHRPRYRRVIVVSVLAAALLGLASLAVFNRTIAPPATGHAASIAVVPFRQPSGAVPSRAAEALTVVVTDALVAAGNIPVVSLESSRRLLEQTDNDIAASLDATHLLVGNVRANDSAFRVSVALVPRETGDAIWSREFLGSQDNLLDLFDSVAREVVDAASDHLGLGGVSAQVHARPTNPIAYDLYLDSVNLDKRFPEGNLRAIRMLEQAVGLEPGFVDARVELAFAYWRTNATPRVKKERVKAVLGEALSQQPRHGAARALLGTIIARCDYEWAKGFDELRSAHDDHPFDARVQALWAHHLGSIHHPDAPQASIVAYQLDPLSGPAVEDHARSLIVLGRQLDALQVRQNYLQMTAHESTRDVATVEMTIAVGEIEAAERQLEALEAEIGVSHPDARLLRMRLALLQRDLETASSIEAELMERRVNEQVRFEFGSPATLVERYRRAIEQRDPQIIFALLGAKPPPIMQSDWDEFRKMVKADEITTPVVTNYRQRSAAEIGELTASELPIDATLLANAIGVYASDGFPTLTFEAKGDHLVLSLGQVGAGVEARLVHTGPNVFEMVNLGGYRYEFGDGSLVAYDGQIRRDYVKR